LRQQSDLSTVHFYELESTEFVLLSRDYQLHLSKEAM